MANIVRTYFKSLRRGSRLAVATLALGWLVLNILPYVLVNDFAFEFSLHHRYEGGVELILFALALPVVFIIDGLLFVVLFALFGQAASLSASSIFRLIARLATCAIFLICTSYYTCLLFSWFSFKLTGTFLGQDSFSLLDFLIDLPGFLTDTGRSDIFRLVIGVLVAVLIAGWIWKVSTLVRSAKSFFRLVAALVVLSSATFLGPKMLAQSMQPERKAFFRSIIQNFFAPQLSLYWGVLWFGPPPKSFEQVTMDLPPSYSLDDYVAKLGAPALKKNILVIMVEAMRADTLAAYGSDPKIAPNINQLAADSVVFRHAYSQAAETDYSQGAILTSLYQLKFPYRDVHKDTNYPFVRIYDLLSKLGWLSGYFTHEWAVTRLVTDSPALDIHLDPKMIPVEQIKAALPEGQVKLESGTGLPSMATSDRYNILKLKEWIAKAHDAGKPFMGSIYLAASHYPFTPPPDYQPLFLPNDIKPYVGSISFLDYPEGLTTLMKNRYLNDINFIDSLVGDLINFLKQSGLFENTVIFVTGDHGELFHEHGLVNHANHLYEEAIKVPMVVSGVKDLCPIASDQYTVGHIDIAPSILEILGLPTLGYFQGRSMFGADACTGNPLPARLLFSTTQLVVQEDCVHRWPWKYCYNQRKLEDRLFDLASDPGEAHNIFGAEPVVGQELKQALADFRNKQLSYYSPGSPYRKANFAPKF